MNHIEKNWKEFRGKCLADGAPDESLEKARDIFFAGAVSALAEISQARSVSEDYFKLTLREFAEEAETYGLEMLTNYLAKRKAARS